MRVAPTTGVAAVALVLAGFLAGWFLAPRSSGDVAETPAPPATTVVPPGEDVPGAEVPGMPRYPGSVRTQYERQDFGEVVNTDVEYVTTDEPEDVRDFYRGVFEDGGWQEADVGFDRGEISYFVIKGEREVQVEVEEHGGITEIEIEDEEPSP